MSDTKAEVQDVKAAASTATPAPADGAAPAADEKKKKKKKKKPAAAADATASAAAATATPTPAPAAAASAPLSEKDRKEKEKEREREKEKERERERAKKMKEALEKEKKKLLEVGGKDSELVNTIYGGIKSKGEKKEHIFWDTQPVPKIDEKVQENEPIEKKELKDVNPNPYPLPAGFEWCSCDVKDTKTLDEVYTLLTENYVEDDDNMFRFDYSREFLQWALMPPGFIQDWHAGVRASKSKKLVGFITAIPAHIDVYQKTLPMVEINFLCVHKNLRAKRLAPVLIKEITRRVNLRNIWQAVYTAGVVLPKPVAQNRYYHRSLNPKKLIEIGFSRLQPRMTMALTVKLYKLPSSPTTKGLRPMTRADVPEACALLTGYLKNFNLAQHYTEADFAHWLLPVPGVVYSWVVEDPTTKKITDLISFYELPSSIIGNATYSTLKAAYSFYNVSTKTPLLQLMTDALILAKSLHFDVFNALNVMENDSFLKELKFGPGDGHLQYYLYNWKCPEMPPSKVGLVLL